MVDECRPVEPDEEQEEQVRDRRSRYRRRSSSDSEDADSSRSRQRRDRQKRKNKVERQESDASDGEQAIWTVIERPVSDFCLSTQASKFVYPLHTTLLCTWMFTAKTTD